MTPVILLCAGKSSRMGEPKGLVLREGKPWIEQQLRKIAKCGFNDVIVVLGHDLELYRSALPWIGKAESETQGASAPEIHGLRIHLAINPEPELGQFSSLQTGARAALAGRATAAWILPIDCPCPTAAVWEALSVSRAEVVVPVHGGKGGHPVRISAPQLKHLVALDPRDPEARLDVQNRKLGEALERIEVSDPGIHANFNTPEDWI